MGCGSCLRPKRGAAEPTRVRFRCARSRYPSHPERLSTPRTRPANRPYLNAPLEIGYGTGDLTPAGSAEPLESPILFGRDTLSPSFSWTWLVMLKTKYLVRNPLGSTRERSERSR